MILLLQPLVANDCLQLSQSSTLNRKPQTSAHNIENNHRLLLLSLLRTSELVAHRHPHLPAEFEHLDFLLAVTFAGFLATYFHSVFALTAAREGGFEGKIYVGKDLLMPSLP